MRYIKFFEITCTRHLRASSCMRPSLSLHSHHHLLLELKLQLLSSLSISAIRANNYNTLSFLDGEFAKSVQFFKVL